ncbi:MAG: TlyA family RNA methyltransferase [Candidatus Bipolaricaulia bacterium]
MSKGIRLDRALVERQFFASRSGAQRAIRAGEVFVDGRLVDKPATPIQPDAQIQLTQKPRYVSQGGRKLEQAIQAFSLSVEGAVCLDVGASTGGFTDCLLQHGARMVYAVDVGKGQLDWPLRNDDRVVALEDVNARYLTFAAIGETADIATVDLSFISLRKVLPPIAKIVRPEGELISLVKPQFEAGRDQVERGGVVKDPEIHESVLRDIAGCVQMELGLSVLDGTHSPVTGPAGNVEFLLHLLNAEGRSKTLDWRAIVESAHRELAP